MGWKLAAMTMALVAGVAMAFQGSLNSALGKVIGLLEATFIVHLTGTVFVAALLLLRLGRGNIQAYAQADWYLYLGGMIGVLIVYGVVLSIPRVGVAIATTAIIVGQVATALLIDHFGFFGLQEVPFTWTKLAGLILLALGARLMLN